MIRIKPYMEHPEGKKIRDLYLYMIAKVMPFRPEDILGTDVIIVEGEEIRAENFIEQSGKRPCSDDEHMDKNQRFEADYLIAARTVYRVDQKLYDFIYDEKLDEENPGKIPKVNQENLHRLLFSRMDYLDQDIKELPKIQGDDAKLLLNLVFRYKAFSRSAYISKLSGYMDVKVCPYCNRSYTVTLSKGKGKSRPQFDHFKSKMKYPYFALSLLNLIPCCGLCNQAKLERENNILYPYFDEMGTDILFRTQIENGIRYLTGAEQTEDEFSVVLEAVNDVDTDIVIRSVQSDQVFHLTELYNEHKDYILKMFSKRYIFNDSYLKMLYQIFGGLFSSEDELKSTLYLMSLNKNEWGKLPLGKLTHDIDSEISELISK